MMTAIKGNNIGGLLSFYDGVLCANKLRFPSGSS